MSVRSNRRYEEQEEDGETELVLAAITYTGSRSIASPQGMRNEGGYPSLDAFQGPGPGDSEGETKIARVPSQGLGWWEGHADFEIAYEPEVFARTLLEKNYISEQITGPNYDSGIRDELTDKLDLDPFTGEDDLREQLRDVVADDGEEVEEPEVEEPDHRVEHLAQEYDRSVLVKVAGSYDEIDDLLDEEDKDSVSHLANTTLAEFLADQDDEEVDRRLTTAEQGGEI